MYHSILVPLDPSEGLASSLPFAASLAKGLGARLNLLAVVSPTGRRQETSRAQAFLQGQVESLADAGVEADSVVDSGRPGRQIVARAQEGGFDLIVMGTRGRSGLRRGLVGSVTDQIVRSSPVPVLVLSPLAIERCAQDDHQLQTVVVPLDGSPMAEAVLPHAEGLAERLSLEVRLLRVVSSGPLAYYGGEGGPVDTFPLNQELEEEAAAYLNQVAAAQTSRGLTANCTVIRGTTAMAIVDQVKEVRRCLVAICTHGRAGLGRLLIGSVVDTLILHAGLPVLVVTSHVAADSSE